MELSLRRLVPRGQPDPVLVDELVWAYVCWREACDDVRDAYRAWSESVGEQWVTRFHGYSASLEREEKAASAYAEILGSLFTDPSWEPLASLGG